MKQGDDKPNKWEITATLAENIFAVLCTKQAKEDKIERTKFICVVLVFFKMY